MANLHALFCLSSLVRRVPWRRPKRPLWSRPQPTGGPQRSKTSRAHPTNPVITNNAASSGITASGNSSKTRSAAAEIDDESSGGAMTATEIEEIGQCPAALCASPVQLDRSLWHDSLQSSAPNHTHRHQAFSVFDRAPSCSPNWRDQEATRAKISPAEANAPR